MKCFPVFTCSTDRDCYGNGYCKTKVCICLPDYEYALDCSVYGCKFFKLNCSFKYITNQRKKVFLNSSLEDYLFSWSSMIVHLRNKINQTKVFFINKKLKKSFYFLTCILPNHTPHEITKEFWKNRQFKNITAGFLLRCQHSLQWEICLICHWNIDSWKQKLSFGYVMVTKSNQKNHLDTTQTTFSKDNNY